MKTMNKQNENFRVNNFKGTIKNLIQYLGNYRIAVIFSFIGAIIATIMQVIGPNQMKKLTNTIAKGLPQIVDGEIISNAIDLNEVGTIAFSIMVLYLSSAGINLLKNWLMATITQRTSQRLRSDVNTKINFLPFNYFDRHSHGDILSRVTNDVDIIGQALNNSVVGLLTAITQFIGVLIMMFYNSWQLTLTAILSTIFGFVFMLLIVKKSQTFFRTQQSKLGQINGFIEEMYSGQQIMKAYNGIEESTKAFDSMNIELAENAWKAQFLSGLMMPVMQFISNFGYVMVSIVGAVLAMNGTISFGVIVAFMIYIRLFTDPLSQIAQGINNLQLAVAAGERVFELLNEEEITDESQKLKDIGQISGNVEFRNVQFSYEVGNPIIKNFSAKISAGQKVAIVGPTGAGKTTIVNLLMRFYEVDQGEILLDGVPTKQIVRETLREQFSMILQDSWLFEGTIRENIAFNDETVPDSEIHQVAKVVGLDHFIRTLPDGYDTLLNDKTSLSHGQRQLMTIARAMIHDAPMLILDEATSSVDTRMEQIVQRAMDQLMEGRTSFVIAHRLSTIRNSDLILVMNHGDIVESGTHQSLLNKNGVYAELYQSQFKTQ